MFESMRQETGGTKGEEVKRAHERFREEYKKWLHAPKERKGPAPVLKDFLAEAAGEKTESAPKETKSPEKAGMEIDLDAFRKAYQEWLRNPKEGKKPEPKDFPKKG